MNNYLPCSQGVIYNEYMLDWTFISHLTNSRPVCNPYEFHQALRRCWNTNVAYHIVRDGLIYGPDNWGHRCFYIKYEHEPYDTAPWPCFRHTHGRISLGCSQVPLCEAVTPWAVNHWPRVLMIKHEIYWYQLGFSRGEQWVIDKQALHSLVDRRQECLMSCPLFRPDLMHQVVDLMPGDIAKDDRRFTFRPIREFSGFQIPIPVFPDEYCPVMPDYLVLRNMAGSPEREVFNSQDCWKGLRDLVSTTCL